MTDTGLRTAMFLTRVHDRFLLTGLAHLKSPGDDKLRRAQAAYQHADDLARHSGLAA